VYKKILVPLDGSHTSERGLQEAIGLAKGLNARLHLLHVVAEFPLLADLATAARHQDTVNNFRRYGQDLLTKAAATVAQAGLQADSALREVTEGHAADAIVQEAASAACDVIVMGTHGRRGLSRLTMGSEAELVVRTSGVPVLLIRHVPMPA
jgi:nucleotide-binding universal stress UspA family protein